MYNYVLVLYKLVVFPNFSDCFEAYYYIRWVYFKCFGLCFFSDRRCVYFHQGHAYQCTCMYVSCKIYCVNVYIIYSCIFPLSVLNLAVVNSCLPIVFCLSQVTDAYSHTFTVYFYWGFFSVCVWSWFYSSSFFFSKKKIFERDERDRDRERESCINPSTFWLFAVSSVIMLILSTLSLLYPDVRNWNDVCSRLFSLRRDD